MSVEKSHCCWKEPDSALFFFIETLVVHSTGVSKLKIFSGTPKLLLSQKSTHINIRRGTWTEMSRVVISQKF